MDLKRLFSIVIVEKKGVESRGYEIYRSNPSFSSLVLSQTDEQFDWLILWANLFISIILSKWQQQSGKLENLFLSVLCHSKGLKIGKKRS